MSIDLSEFDGLVRGQGPKCSMGKILADHPDASTLQAALDAPHIPNTAISRWLKNRGLNITSFTVGHHRRGDCRCAP